MWVDPLQKKYTSLHPNRGIQVWIERLTGKWLDCGKGLLGTSNSSSFALQLTSHTPQTSNARSWHDRLPTGILLNTSNALDCQHIQASSRPVLKAWQINTEKWPRNLAYARNALGLFKPCWGLYGKGIWQQEKSQSTTQKPLQKKSTSR